METQKLHPTVDSECVYVAACANRHENNISCFDDYLLYSRSHCPVIHDLTSNRLVPSFLYGHTDEVNGQCFVIDEQSSNNDSPLDFYVISTSYDKSAIIWHLSRQKKSSTRKLNQSIVYRYESLNQEVFITRCCLRTKDKFVSITTTIDGSIYLWHNDILQQTLTVSYCCLASKLLSLEVGGLLFTFLFLAGADNKIHIYQIVHNHAQLVHLLDLSGHNDWLKYLEIFELPSRHLEFLLASASQDSHIRVWHLRLVDHDIDSRQVRTTEAKLNLTDMEPPKVPYKLTATLETVLSGHDGIVYGLCWFRGQPELTLKLVSCSADKTIVQWDSSVATVEQDQKTNRYEQCPASAEVWKESYRLGETGETNLPFLGICLSKDGSKLFAHSLRGAIHSWRWDKDQASWLAEPLIAGHFDSVTDLCWEKSGAYLLSSSLDKTCRLHAIAKQDSEWHELGRPVVHGHEINCLVSLEFTKFACGAEEKTIRAFEATKFFAKSFAGLTQVGVPSELETTIEALPVHAQLPALGLSNRGALSPYDIGDPNDKANTNDSWYGTSKLVIDLSQMEKLNTPPIEEILLQSTLWWETNKLFGHSNELHALAVDSLGSYIASASKANRPDLATIIVWDCSKFRKVATIEHHALTITRLRFSPDDKYLLSVSRDRTWCISERTGQLRSAYKKLLGTSKSNANHDRIIWDCCWTSDSKYFMTVSRDKKAILWSTEKLGQSLSPEIECVTSKMFDASIQAVDSPDYSPAPGAYLFALGLEDGSFKLCSVSVSPDIDWQVLSSFEHYHQLPIRRLAFQPNCNISKVGEPQSLVLASAGDDCVVRLSKLTVSM